MSIENAVSVQNLSKKFRLFESRRDRIRELIHPLRRKYHQEFWALTDVSFEIPKGCSMAILGRNGSGKSTLLQVIAEVMQPTRGVVKVTGRVAALLELGAGFSPEFTGRENAVLNGILQGYSEQDMLEMLPDIERFADIGRFFDQPVGTYSSGMYIRLAFSVATCATPEILLVDEAISVGDSDFQSKCFNRFRKIRESGRTVVIVSHDKDLIFHHCDRAIVLDAGRVAFEGSVKDAVNHNDALQFSSSPAKQGGRTATSGQPRAASDRTPRVSKLDIRDPGPFFNADHFASGDERAELTELVLRGENNEPVNEIHAGNSLCLEATFLIHDHIDRPSLGFALTTQDGTTIYGTNTQMRAREVSPLHAGELLSMRWSFVTPLLSGIYLINVGLSDLTGEHPVYVDVRRGILRLSIQSDSRATGVVELDCRLDITTNNPSPLDSGQGSPKPSGINRCSG